MKMISIITPTYNRAHLIGRMITGVFAQTFADWELIIVDDGSTDNTKDVVSGFKDKRIRYFTKINSGAAASRNYGVEKANNNYIIFLDSDDEPEPYWLKEMTDEINESNFAAVCCGFQKYNFRGEKLGDENLPKNLGQFFNNTIANYLSGTILLKKEVFESIGGYDEELSSGQHTELFIRLLNTFEVNDLKIKNIYKVLIKINLHSGSRVRNNFHAIYNGSIRVLEKHQKQFLNDKKYYFNYLSVAGVSAIKIGRYQEGQILLKKALKVKPLILVTYFRLGFSFVPFFRDKIWKLNN